MAKAVIWRFGHPMTARLATGYCHRLLLGFWLGWPFRAVCIAPVSDVLAATLTPAQTAQHWEQLMQEFRAK